MQPMSYISNQTLYPSRPCSQLLAYTRLSFSICKPRFSTTSHHAPFIGRGNTCMIHVFWKLEQTFIYSQTLLPWRSCLQLHYSALFLLFLVICVIIIIKITTIPIILIHPPPHITNPKNSGFGWFLLSNLTTETHNPITFKKRSEHHIKR